MRGQIGVTVAGAHGKTTTTSMVSNLLNKAARQTIEAFFEKGIWKIGA